LLQRYIATLHRFFGGRLPHQDVADMVQHTLLACLETRHRMAEVRRFRGFLLGIARKVHLKHQRGYGREQRMLARARGDFDAAHGPAIGTARREARGTLLIAMRRLPCDLQLVLELHYWEQLSTAEIADVIDVPRGTVLSRLHRARTLLRKHVRAQGWPMRASATS
jgi:RNA polymerase sigma-70 factor (ECF subfamily)